MKLLGKAISGTCGARTYSVGGAGVTARQKTCPVNKNSLAQARRRGLFAAAGAAFKSLTAEQRAELHARALAASDTDIFGKKITLSDYAFFLREWMRGIRPAPSEDSSIQLLNRFRNIEWKSPIFNPGIVFLMPKSGTLPSDLQSLVKPNEKRFTLLFSDGEAVPSFSADVISPTNLATAYESTRSSGFLACKFTDVLGRVFTF